MQFSQPEIETAVQQMEQIRNQATIYEQESIRFQKLVIAEEYKLSQILAQTKEAQENSKKAQEELLAKKVELDQLNADLIEARTEAKKLADDKLDFETKKAQHAEEYKLKNNILVAAQAALDEQTETLVKKQDKLDTESKEFTKKVNKLKEVLVDLV
jgi:chromosome segregation ATPase